MSLAMRASRRYLILTAVCAISACGGGGGGGAPPPPPAVTYTVTATVSGLSGSGLTIVDNGADTHAVTGNGSVTFAAALASGAAYAVTVGMQPNSPSQTCTVTNGSGTIANSNVSSVAVTCTTKTFTVGGSVTGLAGAGLTLADNGSDNLSVTSGLFTFTTPVASGAAYAVTVVTQPSSPMQTCTVSNGTGTVASASVSNVIVACVNDAFTIGGAVSGLSGAGLKLQNNAGDTLAVAQNGTFTFATPELSGANYAITVSANPTNPIQKCVVANGAGTVGSANVSNASIACTTQTARTAFSLNYYGGTFSGYSVDSSSGQLRLRGLIKTGNTPINFYGDKAGKFLFVLNQGSAQTPAAVPPVPQTQSSISAFTLDPETADALEVAGSPFATSGGQSAATGLTGHPSDGFLYVTNAALNNIDAFAVGPAATLTSVAGSPFATGASPNPIVFDNGGHFAYVSNNTASSIFVYSVNSTTGSLTELQVDRVATGVSPGPVFLTADGRFAYVLNSVSTSQPTISGYTVNSGSGALTAMSGSPFSVTSGGGIGTTLLTLIPNPNGNALYVKNDGGTSIGSISQLSIDPVTGALAPFTVLAHSVGYSATGTVGMDPAGRFLYVANQGTCTLASGCVPGLASTGSISSFSIDSTGSLSPLPDFPVTPPPYSVSVDPSGEFLYKSAPDSDQANAYSINQVTGALALLSAGGTSRTGGEPLFIGSFIAPKIPTPNVFLGRFAYVPNVADNSVSVYSSDPATGKLAVVGSPVSAGIAPQAVAVSLRGNVAFVASAGSSPTATNGTLTAFSINATSGTLTAVPGALPAGKGPAGVAADRTGRYVYVANGFDGTISSYGADVTSGALTALGAPTGTSLSDLIGVAVDPTGRNLYALGASDLEIFVIDPGSGAIVPSSLGFSAFGPSVVSLPAPGATQLTVDPNGNFAYIPIFNSKMIAVFQINPYAGTFGLSIPLQIPTGRANTSIAVEPTGRFAYTADFTDNTISAYTIDQTNGNLTAIGSSIPVAANAISITTDFSGKFVYAVLTNKTVLTFSIGNSGALTAVAGGSVATGNSPGPITTVGAVR